MRDMKNMSSDNYPYSSPRKNREAIKSEIINPQNIFSANDKLGYIADGKLYYDDKEIGTAGVTSSIIDFNGNIVMYPSNFVYDYVEDDYGSILTKLPIGTGSYDRATGDLNTNGYITFGSRTDEKASSFIFNK